MSEKIIGIAVRYSDKLHERSVDTVSEHNKIIRENGAVYLGKFGRYIGSSNLAIFNEESSERYLILVKKDDRVYSFYIAPICGVYKTIQDTKLVPEYYRNNRGISTWFYIKEEIKKMSDEEVSEWILRSSKFSLRLTLTRSMAGFFIVTKGQPLDGAGAEPIARRKRGKSKLKDKPFYYDKDLIDISLLDEFDDLDY
jgi:hypothetical protein